MAGCFIRQVRLLIITREPRSSLLSIRNQSYHYADKIAIDICLDLTRGSC